MLKRYTSHRLDGVELSVAGSSNTIERAAVIASIADKDVRHGVNRAALVGRVLAGAREPLATRRDVNFASGVTKSEEPPCDEVLNHNLSDRQKRYIPGMMGTRSFLLLMRVTSPTSESTRLAHAGLPTRGDE